MIRLAELVNIGKFGKPHGVKGEINMLIEPGLDPSLLRCIVMDVNGIFVPFFIESSRERGNGAYLVTINRLVTEEQVSIMVNKDIYALRDDKALETFEDENEDDEGMYASDLIGYTIIGENGQTIGEITDIDDSTENILFIVESPDGQNKYLIPVATEFIDEIIPESHTIMMTLPEGLLEQ
ncbi:MAG: ribosome maturation factor RimM [Muribaculaceae bacterium]|nr:ribosome maturation factor RimM [Muribaculaceae bacterium]